MAKVVECTDKRWAKIHAKAWSMTGHDKERELLDEYTRVSDHVSGKKTLVGVLIGFPHADGKALYRVVKDKPLTLEHVPYGDAWRLPAYAERGITAADIRQSIAFTEFWRKQCQKQERN